MGLALEEHFYDDKIDRHITAMRLNFYPDVKEPSKTGRLRGGEHTNYAILTILNGENVLGGLHVKTRGGAWIDVVTDPNTFVVNIGDLLMRWTNDRWLWNVDRVATPPGNAGGAKRSSMAFFHHPNYDALIECAAPCCQAKYTPVLSGEYRDLKYRLDQLLAYIEGELLVFRESPRTRRSQASQSNGTAQDQSQQHASRQPRRGRR